MMIMGDLYAESGQTLQGSFSAGWLAGKPRAAPAPPAHPPSRRRAPRPRRPGPAGRSRTPPGARRRAAASGTRGAASRGGSPAFLLTSNILSNFFLTFRKSFSENFKIFKKFFQKFFGNFGDAGDFFADRFENFSARGGAKAGVAGRSRQMLRVAYFVAKIGLDPAANEPRQDCKFSGNFRKFRRRWRLLRGPFRKIFDAGRCKSWECG